MRANESNNQILLVDIKGIRRMTIEFYLRRLGYDPILIDNSTAALKEFYELKDLPVVAVYTGVSSQQAMLNTSRMLDTMHSLRPDTKSLMITDQDVKKFTPARQILPLKFGQQDFNLALNNILNSDLQMAA